ncbi:MAG: hypothetical protein JWM00_361 [Candidatus Saccharibacteria bacterium]|nr:hypothetical protein [Candidatus Saccharibacteria bacterium]
MPGIELKVYTDGCTIEESAGEKIITIVHDVIEKYNKRRPGHSNFDYSEYSLRNVSDYDYILVVDGETTKWTKKHQEKIRKLIKKRVATFLHLRPSQIAVRYRLMNASFG